MLLIISLELVLTLLSLPEVWRRVVCSVQINISPSNIFHLCFLFKDFIETVRLFLVPMSVSIHGLNTYAADHARTSLGCVLIAAFVNCLRMSGSSGGMLIC